MTMHKITIAAALMLFLSGNALSSEAPLVGDTVLLPMIVQQFPWVASALAAIGLMRLVMKPIFGVIYSIVYATPTKRDDEWLAKMESSVTLRILAYMLDYLGSIKVVHPDTEPFMSIPTSIPQSPSSLQSSSSSSSYKPTS